MDLDAMKGESEGDAFTRMSSYAEQHSGIAHVQGSLEGSANTAPSYPILPVYSTRCSEPGVRCGLSTMLSADSQRNLGAIRLSW